jgi:enoyl-CoA hydratase/carnithine racemase
VTIEGLANQERAAAVIADLVALGGAGLSITDFSEARAPATAGAGVVKLGVHRGGALPIDGLDDFDILLSADARAPAPWVHIPSHKLDAEIETLSARVEAQPAAAAAAAQVLRMTLALPFDQALILESLAYSMLLASSGFRTWRAANPARPRAPDATQRVLIDQNGGTLTIRLNRPDARNAFDAAMRDELSEALIFAGAHPDKPKVVLSGAGPAFSAGGDLDEFGSADDVARAHLIRTLRSPAKLIAALGARVTAHLHGACVGAGIETPAAARHVAARAGAFFRLPEVGMGLIPGAGGTATIARRIGRHRCAYMAISGADIDLPTALAWGLLDSELAP